MILPASKERDSIRGQSSILRSEDEDLIIADIGFYASAIGLLFNRTWYHDDCVLINEREALPPKNGLIG